MRLLIKGQNRALMNNVSPTSWCFWPFTYADCGECNCVNQCSQYTICDSAPNSYKSNMSV